jgi:hypothetical protein
MLGGFLRARLQARPAIAEIDVGLIRHDKTGLPIAHLDLSGCYLT